jgi:chromosome segregation ATPase
VIEKLKAENAEYKQKEKDYNLLHSQLLDLEQKHRKILDEKNQKEVEIKEIDNLHAKKNENLQAEIRNMKISLEEKQKVLKDLELELSAVKKAAEEKGGDISKIRSEIAGSTADNSVLVREKKRIAGEIKGESERKKAADLEIERLSQLNDRENSAVHLADNKHKENELEIIRLKRRIDEISDKINVEQKIQEEKEAGIGASLEDKRVVNKEIERLQGTNLMLENDNNNLSIKIKDYELQLDQANSRIQGTYAVIDNKDKEIRSTKLSLANIEGKTIDAIEQSKKIKRDNDVLEVLLSKYRSDVNQHKKVRENEISEKLDLLEEKKVLERKVLHKEIEAKSAKHELQKVQKNKEYVLDNNYQLNKELDALKDHANVLETQNFTVFYLIL